MKKLMLFCAALAVAGSTLLTGCGTTSATSQAVDPSTAVTDLAAAVSNAVAAYNQLYPVYTQLEAIVHSTRDVPETSARAVVAPAKRAAAVICGLTAVDPAKYGGWKGDCPGCDVDAQAFAIACQSEGVPYELLLNRQANYIGIVASAKRACATLSAGDLLVIYISGHGGQVADTSGDEADGKDETLCLWDGQLSDDAVWQLLAQVPKGVRVWMITDTCNSGTNYRAPHSYRSRIADGPTLLHWGGCADGKSSFGSAQGGTFTTALVDSYRTGQSYADWFASAKRRMPFTQRPTCEFTGSDYQSLPSFR